MNENRHPAGLKTVSSQPSQPDQPKTGDIPGIRTAVQDISERKRAEMAMHRLAAIVEASDDAIISKDLDGLITSWNRGAEKIFGYTASEMVGTSLMRLVPADRQDEEQQILNRVKRGESTEQLVTVRQAKDGQLIDVMVTASPIKDAAGQVIGVAKVAGDIRLQKARQHELVQERNFSDTVVNNLPGVFYVVDRNGKSLRWNKNVEKVTGYTAAEIAAMLPLDFFAPADRESVSERINEVFQNGASSVEAGLLGKDGRVTPHYFTAARVCLEGQTCLLGVGLDVTERNRVENELRWRTTFFETLVESIVDGVIVVDNQRKKIIQNHRLAELWNLPPDLIENDDTSAMVQFAAAQTKNPRQFIDMVAQSDVRSDAVGPIELELVDGRILECHSSAVQDKDGKYYGRIWTFRDLTEHRRLEAEMRQAQKLEGIGQLAGGVAHDFNNLLATIQMNADLLRIDDQIAPAQLEIAKEIGVTVQRAAALTRQLLLFSRKQTMQLRELDLNESIGDMTKILQRTLGEQIQLQFKFSRQSLVVYADAGMLDQVLLNLAVNARDAMPNGGQLVIETSAVEFDEIAATHMLQARPGQFVCLSVSDAGYGIPPEILPRIFEPFFTTKEVGKGTGLGLATVFGIVQQHQGWINVHSEVGHGTSFRLYLPCLAAPAGQKPEETALASLGGGKETILFVEDDLSLHDSVRKILSQLGYRVLAATNGVEALDLWNRHRAGIHLLLTDLVLPGGITGKGLGQRLAQENPRLKVIYASGYSAEVVGKDFSLLEGVNYLSKPYAARQLAQAIRQCLDQKSA